MENKSLLQKRGGCILDLVIPNPRGKSGAEGVLGMTM
jgi:hypothetical protein